MTRKQARDLARKINLKGGKARIYDNYSGRAMYGETTTAVVCGPHDYNFEKSKFRSDNFGFDKIVY